MKKVMFMAVFAALSAGCGSVTQPVAEIPLVDNGSLLTSDHVKAGQQKINELIDTSQIDADSVKIGGVNYTVGRTFYAASGKNCKFLSSAQDKRLYCYDDAHRGWQLIDDVIVETNVNNQEK